MTDETAVEFCKIAPALMSLRAPIGAFQTHPENPRVGNVEAIASSLAKFGQQKPIVVQQSSGYVVAGNHTFKAAVTLKWSHIAASVVDLDDETALQYLVVDNATSDLADYEKAAQARLYQNLYDRGGQLALTGTGIAVDQDTLDTWAALGGTNTEIEPEKPFKGDYATGPEPAIETVPNPDDPQKAPKREVVLLLEIEDAQLMSMRLKNLQRHFPEGGGMTAAILHSVATAHEHVYGTPDPTSVEAPQPPAAATAAAAADVPLAPADSPSEDAA